MNVDVVVDVGNTRIKWGRCSSGQITGIASLPPDAEEEWRRQIVAWELPPASSWLLTGVHPARRTALAAWLESHGERVVVVTDWRQIPVKVALQHPERVGIDRLLNAAAALSRRLVGEPAVIVDAGSAVTVDWLDASGDFRGGAIFPGLRLMAEALHAYTAALPLVEVRSDEPELPGIDTVSAMKAGIFWAAAGGVRMMIERLAKLEKSEPRVFLTGGDGPRLSPFIGRPAIVWPGMTLEGVRLTAEALP